MNSKPGGSTHLNSENIHLNIERIIFPFFLKEKILQSYLREANRIFQVKVYEILCFKVTNDLVKKISFLYVSDKNQTKNNQSINFPQISKPSKFQQNADIYPKPEPNETYFFSMYLEIGESAEKQKYKAEKKLTDEALEEAIEKGLLKFKNTDLEINANYMDIDGNLKSIDTWRGLIQNIKINNIYKDGFEGNPPMPASDFLEMTIIDYENSKQRDHSAKHASLIAKYGREQLQNAFFALNMSFSIYSAVITEPSGKEFDICVDGKVYGGFQQIIIQPLISQEKKDFKLMIPIMTFLPLNI